MKATDPREMDDGWTFSWMISGDRFIRGQREKGFFEQGRWAWRAAYWASDLFQWQTFHRIRWDFEPESLQITHISDSWIRVKDDESKGGASWVLTRIPE